MSDEIVVDASALGAVLFREPEAKKVEKSISTFRWIVPVLADYEIGSIYLKKLKLYPDLKSQLDIGYQIYLDSDIDRVDVPVNHAISVAIEHQLTICDATYFWLAEKLELNLITLDRKLNSAWTQK